MKEYSLGDELDIGDELEGAIAVVHEYTNGGWDGYGWALIKYPEGWCEHDLSHCSCFEPWDYYSRGDYRTLAEIRANMSEECLQQCAKIFEEIEKLGLEP